MEVEQFMEMEVEQFMEVKVVTEYCGNHEYRIAVVVDGAVEEVFPATLPTVAKVRNRTCERWSEVADRVEANEIPMYGI